MRNADSGLAEWNDFACLDRNKEIAMRVSRVSMLGARTRCALLALTAAVPLAAQGLPPVPLWPAFASAACGKSGKN